MAELTHYIVRSAGFPLYWGKGETIEAAIKDAVWIAPGDTVHLIHCDAKAYIDDTGSLMYNARDRLGTGKVARNKRGLVKINPEGGME